MGDLFELEQDTFMTKEWSATARFSSKEQAENFISNYANQNLTSEFLSKIIERDFCFPKGANTSDDLSIVEFNIYMNKGNKALGFLYWFRDQSIVDQESIISWFMNYPNESKD